MTDWLLIIGALICLIAICAAKGVGLQRRRPNYRPRQAENQAGDSDCHARSHMADQRHKPAAETDADGMNGRRPGLPPE
jgi:hypothetical protein